jgi:hypothetical protein
VCRGARWALHAGNFNDLAAWKRDAQCQVGSERAQNKRAAVQWRPFAPSVRNSSNRGLGDNSVTSYSKLVPGDRFIGRIWEAAR